MDITDSDTPQVRPPLEGIAIGLYELKIPQATHWVIFVPQECSATLLRDISARKRCPSAPPRKITEKFRLLTSPRHRHSSFRRIGGALSNLQHIKIIQTYVSTLVNHHSMPQILSALGKMIGTTQNACLSLRPHQGFTDLINRQRMIMPSIIWIHIYRLGCHPSLFTMKNHAPATPQSRFSIFNQDLIRRLLDKCVK